MPKLQQDQNILRPWENSTNHRFYKVHEEKNKLPDVAGYQIVFRNKKQKQKKSDVIFQIERQNSVPVSD